MASGTKIAEAYVEVVPKAEGFGSSLSSTLNKESASAGESAGESAGNSLVKKITKIIAAAGIGTAIVNTVKSALSESADYEQNIGGIETLFKESSDTMVKYANDAYKTAGLSANDYMETTTSFAASMLSSVGGDTEKAAELSNAAVIAMSDNANKMGTDMESIQNAYQGFAKQNYTMLDNLKLGYGGTKEEMERLLEDATALSGVEYDIDSFADITEAIQVVQDNLGITGTTAKEASETFSGSLSSMQGAWSNLLAQIGNGGDVQTAAANLATSASTFIFGNLIPMLGEIVKSIPSVIKTFVTEGIPLILEEGKEILASIVEGFRENKGSWNEAINEALDNAIVWVQEKLPEMIQSGLETLQAFIDGWGSGDGQTMAAVGKVIGKILLVLVQALPQILAAGAQMILKLGAGIIKNIPYAVRQIGILVKQMLQNFKTSGNWKDMGKYIISGIVSGLWNSVSALWEAIKNIAKTALSSFAKTLGIASPSKEFAKMGMWSMAGLAEGITDNSDMVQSAIGDVASQTLGIANDELAVSSSVVASGNVTAESTSTATAVLSLLQTYLPLLNNNKIYLDGKTLVGGIIKDVDSELGNLASMKLRGAY